MLKSKKILLLNDVEKKCFNRTEKEVRNRNVATFYQIATIFNFDKLEKFSMCYIERCFPMVCKKNNFKNLSLALIVKITSSSELSIDSEMEVINAIDNWISYDFEERSKFAIRLLSKVRFNLLSFDALNSILDSDLSVSKIDDCVAKLNDVLNNKISLQNTTNRYCSQSMYSIILEGGIEDQTNGRKFSEVTKQINVKNFNNVTEIGSIKKKMLCQNLVYCRGAIYVLGGYDENGGLIKSVEKYSLATNKWEIISKMSDDRKGFCVCRFMEHIFIIGGCNDLISDPFYFCKKFDTKDTKWNEVAETNKARIDAASTVYEGRIVVSGGCIENNRFNVTNTVEAYDPFADTWSSMPSMIEGRYCHSSVAIKNKFFVFGSRDGKGSKSCEVFDSICNNFVLLKRFPSTLKFDLKFSNTFSIGNKLATIGNNSSTVLYYDVEKDEWSEETCNLTKNKSFFSCSFLPHIKF